MFVDMHQDLGAEVARAHRVLETCSFENEYSKCDAGSGEAKVAWKCQRSSRMLIDFFLHVPRYLFHDYLDAFGGIRSIDGCGNFGITCMPDGDCENLK
jgi:hypothetical protein